MSDPSAMFRFVEAQLRLKNAEAARAAAEKEWVAADGAFYDAWEALSADERATVNDAYAVERAEIAGG